MDVAYFRTKISFNCIFFVYAYQFFILVLNIFISEYIFPQLFESSSKLGSYPRQESYATIKIGYKVKFISHTTPKIKCF